MSTAPGGIGPIDMTPGRPAFPVDWGPQSSLPAPMGSTRIASNDTGYWPGGFPSISEAFQTAIGEAPADPPHGFANSPGMFGGLGPVPLPKATPPAGVTIVPTTPAKPASSAAPAWPTGLDVGPAPVPPTPAAQKSVTSKVLGNPVIRALLGFAAGGPIGAGLSLLGGRLNGPALLGGRSLSSMPGGSVFTNASGGGYYNPFGTGGTVGMSGGNTYAYQGSQGFYTTPGGNVFSYERDFSPGTTAGAMQRDGISF